MAATSTKKGPGRSHAQGETKDKMEVDKAKPRQCRLRVKWVVDPMERLGTADVHPRHKRRGRSIAAKRHRRAGKKPCRMARFGYSQVHGKWVKVS